MKKYIFSFISIIVLIVNCLKAQDTIYNIPFATRIDSLIQFLDSEYGVPVIWSQLKRWEVMWVDDTVRVDVKNGDVLRLIYEGTVEEYYLQVNDFQPGNNALLSAITWPDIPECYRGIFGWREDTIPNFSPPVHSYKVLVPFDIKGIPALYAKTADVNAHLVADMARNLYGTVQDKTFTFTSTAEDDSTVLVYKVQLEKERDPLYMQPWCAEPFISEFIFFDQGNNGMVEICNPGNLPIDLSNYMFIGQWNNDPYSAIESYAASDYETWLNRYVKYIPGYKWQPFKDWSVKPAIAKQDLLVNPIVYPGDVFVMSSIWTKEYSNSSNSYNPWQYGIDWPGEAQANVIFHNVAPAQNTWNEPINESCARQWSGADFYIFKMINDSIRLGLKPATDPNDFVLIETFGNSDSSAWNPCGFSIDTITSCIRKPEYYLPKPGFAESFGATPEESEWIIKDRAYFDANQVPFPADILKVVEDLGSHTMKEVTIYKSTVTSKIYRVSPGYSLDETISGLQVGIKVVDFLKNIIKADSCQILTVIKSSSGDVLTDEEVILHGDRLNVVSSDSVNTSKYFLDFLSPGLSTNAILTSTEYTIGISGDSGSIAGIQHWAYVKDVIKNIKIPSGATLYLTDEQGSYIPLKILTRNGDYLDIKVDNGLYFKVFAENGIDSIVYRLIQETITDKLAVSSQIFEINNTVPSISLLPYGISVKSFLEKIMVANNAKISIVDKTGLQRLIGTITFDDRLKVISSDLSDSIYYYLNFDKEVIYEQNLVVHADAGPDLSICIGDSVILSASGGQIVKWDHNVINGEPFYPVETMDYIVTVSNYYFTDYDTVWVVVNEYPLSDAGPDQELCGIKTVLSANELNGANGQWTVVEGEASILNPLSAYTEVELGEGINVFRWIVTQHGCSAVDELTVNNHNIDMSVTTDYPPVICKDASTGWVEAIVTGGMSPYTYKWSNGGDSHKLVNITAGNYEVIVKDTNGCEVIGYASINQAYPYNNQEICLVSTNVNNKNIVIWDPVDGHGTASYNIFRETNIINIYDSIGTSDFGSPGIFIDENSDPNIQSYRYKISVIDTCGNESGLSSYHSTMHLTLHIGLSLETNLIWSKYEGFEVQTFNIWRGSDIDSMFIIGSISGNDSTYTDEYPLAGTNIYQVEVVSPYLCNPDSLKTTYSSSFSNRAYRYPEGIDNLVYINTLYIYPNPFIESTILRFNNPEEHQYKLYIMDLSGKICRIIDDVDSSEYELEKGNLIEGFYFIELKGPKIFRGKIIIE